MRFDFAAEIARVQAEASQTFAELFRGLPPPAHLAELPQVLVTGFGRFLHHTENATGRLVAELVPEARYPRTARGSLADVDVPAPQFSIGWNKVTLAKVGAVALCGMIVPSHWGLGPRLLRKQLAAMKVQFVMMNGIATPKQPLWIELGAANRAAAKVDGSGILRPTERKTGQGQALLPQGPSTYSSRSAFFALRSAARKRIAQETSLHDALVGAEFQVFARSENRYLCNELTYAACDLLRRRRASHVFLHWPSTLNASHMASMAKVARALISAELASDPEERLLGRAVRVR